MDETVKELKAKRAELESERARLQDKLDAVRRKISALDETIDLFSSPLSGEHSTSKSAERLPDWPEGESIPVKVRHVFSGIQMIMQPGEMQEYLEINSDEESVRDHAAAETMSRLARKGNLERKRYDGYSSNFYGLEDWWDASDDDFAEDFKPPQLRQDKRSLLSNSQEE